MKPKRKHTEPAGARVREVALLPHPGEIADSNFEEIEQIRKGFPVTRFFELQKTLGVGTAELANLVGIPVRTLQRRKEEGRLTKEESDRLDRVGVLAEKAAAVFSSEQAAQKWLTSPQLGLAGLVPLDLADTGAGIREVEALLGRIDYGVYA